MAKTKEEKISGAGYFLDNSDQEHGGILRVRVPRATDLSVPDKSAAEAILAAPKDQILERPLENKPSKAWPSKSLIKGRKHTLAIMGLSKESLEAGDQKYAEMVRLADSYRKHRAREFVIAHGFVSAGVSSLLSTAALALAASRFVYEKASQTGDVQLMIQASKLATDARQSELAAFELAAREAVARRKAAASSKEVPWVVSSKEGVSGGRPRGRPRKSAVVKEDLDAYVVTENDSEGVKEETSTGEILEPGRDNN